MLLGAFALLSSVFVACDKYDDDIEGLQAQIDALKATVQSLQSEIDGGAVITNVAESSTGVTVTLSNGKSFTISNGTDGEDGADGTPGTVVEMGENGNWYIDGEDTGVPFTGKDGQSGSVVEIGENGNLFIDGEDTGISSASSEGGITAIFENGIVTLYGVKGLEDGYVIGAASHIASLAVVPVEMTENMGMPVVSNYIITKEGEFVASNDLEMTYRVNPANAYIDSVNFSFVNRVVTTTKAFAGADASTLLEFVSFEKSDAIKGAIDVTAKVLVDPITLLDKDNANEHNVFALMAVNNDGCEIVSDYAELCSKELSDFAVVNVYKGTKDEEADLPWNHECPTERPAIDDENCAEFAYDGQIDLDSVVALAELTYEELVEDFGFDVEYKFTKIEKYLGSDSTNQQKFVKIDENNVVVVDKDFLKANPEGGRAAIGRTPVFKVEASVSDTVLAVAYIKLGILEKAPLAKDTIRVKVELGNLEYSELDINERYPLTWEQMNQDVYEVLAMSAVEFENAYDGGVIEETRPRGVNAIYKEKSQDPSATDAAYAYFNPNKVALGADSVAILLEAEYGAPVKIVFNYNIVHSPKFPALNDEYLLDETTTVEGEANETVQVKGKLWTIDNVERWALRSEMKEFCEDYLAHWADSMPGNHEDLTFEIVGKVVDGKLVTEDLGAELTATDYISSEIYLTKPLGEDDPTEASRTYQVKMNQVMFNGDTCSKVFCVKFIRPFEITVDPLVLKTYQAIPDSAHVDSAVVVKDLDGKVLYADCKVTKYAETYYKFTQEMFDNGLSYELAKLDNTWGFEDGEMKLKLVNDADGNPTILKWYNGGGDLQKNKETSVTVTLVLEELATAAVDGKVTVLSTANSK